MTKISNKFYIGTFIVLFIISTAILLIAITVKTPVPVSGGYLDVGIVALLAFIGIAIRQRDKSTPSYDISHQVAVYLFPLSLWACGYIEFHLISTSFYQVWYGARTYS